MPAAYTLRHLVAATVAALTLLGACAGASGREAAVALPRPALDETAPAASGESTAVFAGGCFWGVEAVFRHVKGVRSAVSGYAGGTKVVPSYDEVSTGTTGHAETVSVRYDPREVSYGELLRVFMSVAHNPTELNRQGPDHGTQYRSVVFYQTPEQKKITEAYIAQLTAARAFPAPIVTEVAPASRFFPAEDYHQDYLARHPYQPYIVYNDAPKLEELKKLFPERYRP
jgi:peptide-methionine (S)-S-oxide reductase